MGQTVDQIEDRIETSREDLRSNLEELGHKANSAFDWRKQFRDNPGAILAIAFASGFILANVIGGSRGRRTEPDFERPVPVARRAADAGSARKGRARRAWDEIQSALVGVVAAKVQNTLAQVVPGFKEQLAAREDDARVINGGPGTH